MSNLHPNQHDYDQLAVMYGTGDGEKDGDKKGGGPPAGKGILETTSASGARL